MFLINDASMHGRRKNSLSCGGGGGVLVLIVMGCFVGFVCCVVRG